MAHYVSSWDAEDFIDNLATEMLEGVENEEEFDRDHAVEAACDEYIPHLIDNLLIYYSDTVELWGQLGHPEPEELGMRRTIMDSITNAVYEAISDAAYGELVYVAADLAEERFAADRASA